MSANNSKNLDELLGELLGHLAEFYKGKLLAGDLGANEQKNLIQLFRDNNITCDPTTGEPLEDILNGNFEGLEDSVLGQHQ